MIRNVLLVAIGAAVAAIAQQPNTSAASMIIGGTNGPPFPIMTQVETSTPVSSLLQGGANAPFAILQSATGQVQAGAASFFGDSFDLPLAPPPIVLVDGFNTPGFHLNAIGQASLSATVPPAFAGSTAAWQMLIADPTSAAGFSLSAATRASFVQGLMVIPMLVGDDGVFVLNLAPFQVPFYGANYSTLYVSANGYMTFGATYSDFTPSDLEMTSGPPKLAGFWCDLDAGATPVMATIDSTSSPTAPGYVRINFTNIPDWSGLGFQHTFSMQIWTTGVVQIAHAATNGPSIYDQITGISPGAGGPQVPEKDLSALLAPNSYVGAPFESIYQWFGNPFTNPYYTQSNDPYDLAGKVITAIPMGGGGLPQATTQYLIF